MIGTRNTGTWYWVSFHHPIVPRYLVVQVMYRHTSINTFTLLCQNLSSAWPRFYLGVTFAADKSAKPTTTFVHRFQSIAIIASHWITFISSRRNCNNLFLSILRQAPIEITRLYLLALLPNNGYFNNGIIHNVMSDVGAFPVTCNRHHQCLLRVPFDRGHSSDHGALRSPSTRWEEIST